MNKSSNEELFISAINGTNPLKVTFKTKGTKDILTRKVIPMDFGPSRRFPHLTDMRYHVIDIESPSGNIHPIPLTEEQIIEIQVTDGHFEPRDYIHWKTNWFTPRDWGMYS